MKKFLGLFKKEKEFLSEAGDGKIMSDYETEQLEFNVSFTLTELIPFIMYTLKAVIKGESLHVFITKMLDGRLLFLVYAITVSLFLKISKIFFDVKNKNNIGYKIWLSMLVGLIAQIAFGILVSTYNSGMNLILNGVLTFIVVVASYVLDRKSFFVIFCLTHGMEV